MRVEEVINLFTPSRAELAVPWYRHGDCAVITTITAVITAVITVVITVVTVVITAVITTNDCTREAGSMILLLS